MSLNICGVVLGDYDEMENIDDYVSITKFTPNDHVKNVLQNVYVQKLDDIFYDPTDEEAEAEDSEDEDDGDDLHGEPYCHLRVDPFENTLVFVDNEGNDVWQAPSLGEFLDHVKRSGNVG